MPRPILELQRGAFAPLKHAGPGGCTATRANSRGKWTLIEFSAIAAVSADGDGSDDAMVVRTPKALPNRRCGGQYDLGTCAHRLGHRRESVDRAQERAPHLLG